jgi:hypothetical protein
MRKLSDREKFDMMSEFQTIAEEVIDGSGGKICALHK